MDPNQDRAVQAAFDGYVKSDERDQQIAHLIRDQIQKENDRIRRCGWTDHHIEYHMIKGEIRGLRKALGFVDPEPWR